MLSYRVFLNQTKNIFIHKMTRLIQLQLTQLEIKTDYTCIIFACTGAGSL